MCHTPRHWSLTAAHVVMRLPGHCSCFLPTRSSTTYTDSALESCTASLRGTVTCPAPGRLLHLSGSPLKSPRRLSLRLTTLPSISPRKSQQRQRTSTTAPTTLTRPLGLAPRIQESFNLPWSEKSCLHFQVKLFPCMPSACGEHSGSPVNSLRPKAFLLWPESFPLA